MTQVPGAAFWHTPPACRSLVVQVERLAALLGRPLDPEQRAAVEVLTGVRPDGRAAALVAVLICPRQNMKTWIFQLIVLARLLEPGGDRLIVWSAHLFDTAQETFRDFLQLIEKHAWLGDLVERIDRGNGEEQITFVGGRRLRFRARAKTGGRGLSGDCVVLDEGFALDPAHMGALLPILSTRRRALVLIGSSAGLAASAILRGFRDRGRVGGAGSPAYVEFCAPGSFADPGCELDRCGHEVGTPGCVMDREDLWLVANPAARAGRIAMDYLREERGALPPGEFGRERLGWWDEPGGLVSLTGTAWAALKDRTSKPLPWPLAIGVDTSKGLRAAVVVAAGWREDGLPHVEVLRTAAGIEWLPEFLQPLAWEHGAVVRILGGSSTAQAIVPALQRARVPVVETSTADYAAAWGLLVREVGEGALRHLGDEILQRSVDVVASVSVGDGGAARPSADKSGGDITAIVAATLARWQLEQSPRQNDQAADGDEFG